MSSDLPILQDELPVLPSEYIALLHVLINTSYRKMGELLGSSAAEMVFSITSDSLVSEPSLWPYRDLDFLSKTLKRWGFKMTTRVIGEELTVDIRCPFARKVHPMLESGKPFCPISQVVLGAVRTQQRRSIMKENRLDKEGAKVTIKLQE